MSENEVRVLARFHPTVKMSLSVLDDLVVYVGRRAPNGESVAWLEREVLAMPPAGPQVYLHVVLPAGDTDAMIGDSTRQAMMHFVRACQDRFDAGAIVLVHSGFVGSTIRSVFSGILFAARPKIPIKMFASPGEAAAYLVGHTSARVPDRESITHHVDRMATQMGLPPLGAG